MWIQAPQCQSLLEPFFVWKMELDLHGFKFAPNLVDEQSLRPLSCDSVSFVASLDELFERGNLHRFYSLIKSRNILCLTPDLIVR